MEHAFVVERDEEIAQRAREPEHASMVGQREYQLLKRLIIEGSDALAFQVCRRLQADRGRVRSPMWADTLTWIEIGEWAKRERLLNAREISLLQRLAGAMPRRAKAGVV